LSFKILNLILKARGAKFGILFEVFISDNIVAPFQMGAGVYARSLSRPEIRHKLLPVFGWCKMSSYQSSISYLKKSTNNCSQNNNDSLTQITRGGCTHGPKRRELFMSNWHGQASKTGQRGGHKHHWQDFKNKSLCCRETGHQYFKLISLAPFSTLSQVKEDSVQSVFVTVLVDSHLSWHQSLFDLMSSRWLDVSCFLLHKAFTL